MHHKDGNHQNNPLNGSNWENLCIYCHDDEHSRGLLGDYLKGGGERGEDGVKIKIKYGVSGIAQTCGICTLITTVPDSLYNPTL